MTKKSKKYIMNILSKKHGTIELKNNGMVVWFFRTQEGDIEVSIHNTITGSCVNSYKCEFNEQTIEKLINIYDNYKINYKNCL